MLLSIYSRSIKDIFLLNSTHETNNQSTNKNFTNKKKHLTECELSDEKIDRKIIDGERQCYYFCSEDDIVRVDTSIGYPCQPFILEER